MGNARQNGRGHPDAPAGPARDADTGRAPGSAAGSPGSAVGSTVEPVSSEVWVRAARAGDTAAFGALVERFEDSLTRFLLVRTGNAEDAEELAQETFLRAWQKLGRYDERHRFATWLFTLARRLAVSRQRSAAAWGRRPELGDDSLAEVEAGSDPSDLVSAHEESHNLWRLAAEVLGVEQRSALWLRYGEDLSIPQIARILGRPRVTVRVWLFRARERLAARLRPDARSTPPTASARLAGAERS